MSDPTPRGPVSPILRTLAQAKAWFAALPRAARESCSSTTAAERRALRRRSSRCTRSQRGLHAALHAARSRRRVGPRREAQGAEGALPASRATAPRSRSRSRAFASFASSSPARAFRAAAASASRASTRCASAPPTSSSASSIAARSRESWCAPSRPWARSSRRGCTWSCRRSRSSSPGASPRQRRWSCGCVRAARWAAPRWERSCTSLPRRCRASTPTGSRW